MIDNKIKQNFTDYLSNSLINTNTTNKKLCSTFHENIENLPNIILYGASGCGKYTSALNIIKNYSKTSLKYSKKILIQNTKAEIYIKISDIHFEIDMEILVCNSRLIWNDIFNNIIDIISSNDNKGIILCKNFHTINNELLEIFYSYMQKELFSNYIIKFILLTEAVSFIPNSIINVSKILNYERLNKVQYKREFNVGNIKNSNIINNLKSLTLIDPNSQEFEDIMLPHRKICDSIINIIINYEDLNQSDLRKVLYDILIYNLNIHECIFYIIKMLINNKYIKNREIINSSLLENTHIFFKYYNNNYRPIYHLENYVLYLVKLIHEL